MINKELAIKISALIGVSILVFGGLFTGTYTKNLKNENSKLNQEIVDLKKTNSDLTQNISDLDNKIKATQNKNNNSTENVTQKINDVAQKFIELYPKYDVSSVEQKKQDLKKIAVDSVADSIVPDDMIKESNKTVDSTLKGGEAYSSDPTFQSRYDSSVVYSDIVSSNQINYFAEVHYKTESSSGNTENTVYINFEVTNQDGKVLVTSYDIKYLK